MDVAEPTVVAAKGERPAVAVGIGDAYLAHQVAHVDSLGMESPFPAAVIYSAQLGGVFLDDPFSGRRHELSYVLRPDW